MKSFKQFVNENKKVELTTEDLERMMDEDSKLDLYHKNLTKLPPLPKGLKELYCNNNNLVELPPLPKGLRVLSCTNNKLTELPPLPKKLRVLSCTYNKLTELPPLPKSLSKLDCNNNNLTKLPPLHEGLNILYCYLNNITKYDLPFPSTLQELLCDNLYGFFDIPTYKKWLEKQQWRKDNPDLATLDDIGLL